jgi:hypothetical protein
MLHPQARDGGKMHPQDQLKAIEMANAWMRSYPSGHRARITKSFETTYSLEVFTPEGERLLDFALLMPSLDLAKETADYVVNAQGEPWVTTQAETPQPN